MSVQSMFVFKMIGLKYLSLCMIYKCALDLFESLKVLKFWYNKWIDCKQYVLVSFCMLDPTREMNCYLLSMWHSPPIYLFSNGLEEI